MTANDNHYREKVMNIITDVTMTNHPLIYQFYDGKLDDVPFVLHLNISDNELMDIENHLSYEFGVPIYGLDENVTISDLLNIVYISGHGVAWD